MCPAPVLRSRVPVPDPEKEALQILPLRVRECDRVIRGGPERFEQLDADSCLRRGGEDHLTEADRVHVVGAAKAEYLSPWCDPCEGPLVQFLVGPACGARVPLCLLYTSPSPRDRQKSRMPSSA